MFGKLSYLVRRELTLTKLKPCSLSREIGFPGFARIVEFGSKRRGLDTEVRLSWIGYGFKRENPAKFRWAR